LSERLKTGKLNKVVSLILVLVVLYVYSELSRDVFKSLGKSEEEIVPNSRFNCEVVRVYDGDTFKCKLGGGKEIKVRLIGIDTPESRRNRKAERDALRSGMSMEKIISMGKRAKEFTKRFLKKGTRVVLETDVQVLDKYGRVLAYVYLPDGRMLNELLVREGYAKVYTFPPNVKYVERFKKAQEEARRKGKGLWREGTL
jgi:micrococcal nuclease